MLPLHIGMHVRLLQHIDLARGLVKDAEGTVVHVEINPADADEVESARHDRRPAYLRHVPLGVWLRMAKYRGGRPLPTDCRGLYLTCAMMMPPHWYSSSL